ncbi:hypothetical protein [Paratractidigestivibacter sp.]|uniref:hypothetical protein n=1 Tax=Paratractidigestivibacter sp. TaxID=2847316 RepID=UPI003AB63CA5
MKPAEEGRAAPKPTKPEPSKPGENARGSAQKKARSDVPATGGSANAALPVAAAIADVALVGAVAIRKRNDRWGAWPTRSSS